MLDERKIVVRMYKLARRLVARWSLPSGNITRPSIRRWRPPWISEFSNNAETNFAFTSKKPWQSSIIAHNLIVVTKTWVQVFLFEVLCALSLSRSRSCSRYLCADNVAIYLHCFCPIDWLLSLFLMNSSFLFSLFFLFSFLPSILPLPRATSTWTWQRLSSLVCTCVPRSFSRQAWFHNPDFSSVFHKTDDGVDAETFFARFFGIKSTSPLRLLKIYQRSCTWSLKDPSTS